MSTSIALPGVEHAPTALTAPVRDRIVLSGPEVRNAYETALATPRLAMTFLADMAALGRTPDARTRARYELAARIVVEHGLAAVYEDKPEPVVSHTTTVTTRTPSRVVQRDPEDNKFVEAADARGGFRVSFVEREDGEYVAPLVTTDVDSEYEERDFAVLVTYLNELLVEMDPTGYLREHGARAVQG